MSCRCGKPPEKKCAECGRLISADAERCRAHPTLDVDAVRCCRCGRHLCGFHITLQPLPKADGTMGQAERCFPSCASTFGAAPKAREPVVQLFSAVRLR